MKNNIKYLYSFPVILNNFSVSASDSDPVVSQLAYGVFLISLVALFCFINILGYIISYYLFRKEIYELKYLNLKRVINYFNRKTLAYFIIESFLCLTFLIFLLLFSFLFIFN